MGKRSHNSLKPFSGKTRAKSPFAWVLSKVINSERGQSLAEVPIAILLACILVLMVVQPVIYLYTQMTLAQVAAGICRIVATEEDTPAGRKETMIRMYATDKLKSLPQGRAFYLAGTLRIEIEGNAKSEQIKVSVFVKQEPLPLMGLLSKTDSSGQVMSKGMAKTRGAHRGVEGSPHSAPQTYGFIDK